MQLKAWPSVKNFVTKSLVNKYHYINMNVIKVKMVIILNYGYGINSIEQCAN